jgi:phosphoglycolate phosphatase-like HAD superfamily hydrolase
VPFPDAAAEALRAVTGYEIAGQDVQQVLAGFAELPAQPDAEPAMRRLAGAGIRIACLTNGSAEATSAFVARAGLELSVEKVISTAEVRSWNPATLVASALRVMSPATATTRLGRGSRWMLRARRGRLRATQDRVRAQRCCHADRCQFR